MPSCAASARARGITRLRVCAPGRGWTRLGCRHLGRRLPGHRLLGHRLLGRLAAVRGGVRDKLVDGGRVGRVARDTHDREWRSDLDLLARVREDAQHRARDLRLDGHIDFLRGYLVDLLA